MSLRENINEQFNIALKNKNKSLISTLRLILAAIKQRDIENRSAAKKDEVKDVEIIKVLRKMKKQRQDSAELYKKGERKKICKEVIESLGATSLKDMGKIMGKLKQKYSDSIDFSKVNIIVKGLLSQ